MSDGLLRGFKTISLMLALGVSMSAGAGFLGFGGDSWKEEVLLHDGSKIIVKRSQSYGGRRDHHTQRFIQRIVDSIDCSRCNWRGN